MTSPVIDAGDGLPLTVPALLRARVAERPDARAAGRATTTSLTYAEADRRSAELARGLLAAGAGAGTRVGAPPPQRARLRGGWLAAARIGAVSVPLSTFSTSAELVGLLRGADVALLLAAAGYRSHDYPASLRAGIPELDLGAPPPLLAAAVPSLRRIAFAVDGPAPAVDPGWTTAGLLGGRRRRSTPTCWPRPRPPSPRPTGW